MVSLTPSLLAGSALDVELDPDFSLDTFQIRGRLYEGRDEAHRYTTSLAAAEAEIGTLALT